MFLHASLRSLKESSEAWIDPEYKFSLNGSLTVSTSLVIPLIQFGDKIPPNHGTYLLGYLFG